MSNDLMTKTDNVPDYLKNEVGTTGLGALESDDYTLPRIKLLQAMSPECKPENGPRPGQYWHTGANKSLGKEFNLVIAHVAKRVILWKPAPKPTDNGELVAISFDGKTWASGANQDIVVPIRGTKRSVTWKTKSNVIESGLLDWGSSDPENEKSAPAASLIYEYCCHIPGSPELSPCLMSAYKTALASAKKINTALLAARKPVYCLLVKVGIKEESAGNSSYYVPTFTLNGFASEVDFKIAKELNSRYAAQRVDTAQYVESAKKEVTEAAIVDDDAIPF